VLRSSQTREEQSGAADNNGQVSVGNELPGAKGQLQESTAARDSSRKTEEIVNYEISRTTKTETIEAGRVNRISVAVLVDGTYGKNDKGEIAYQPREKDEIDRIAALVRSAIGFDQSRGDQVEVVNLRFAETPQSAVGEPAGWLSFLTFTKDDIMYGVELIVMALLGFVVVLLVVRPLVKRILTPEETLADEPQAALVAALNNPAVTVGASGKAEQIKVSPTATAKMIDIAQVQGQVHAQSVQKVGDLADKNPNETVSILRQWLHEETV